jgi:hypothetical protein
MCRRAFSLLRRGFMLEVIAYRLFVSSAVVTFWEVLLMGLDGDVSVILRIVSTKCSLE